MIVSKTELALLKSIREILDSAVNTPDTSSRKLSVMNEAAKHSSKLLNDFINNANLNTDESTEYHK